MTVSLQAVSRTVREGDPQLKLWVFSSDAGVEWRAGRRAGSMYREATYYPLGSDSNEAGH